MICIIAVLAAAAFALTACGESKPSGGETTVDTQTTAAAPAEQSTDDTAAAPAAEAGKFTFTYKGTNMNVKDDAAPILAALGEAKSHTEETSCAFDGLDKTYTYTSFILTTYPDGEMDRVNSITLLDDTVNTADGICIGDSKDKVEEVYGADAFNGVNAYIVTEGDAQLTIILESDKVSSIQYVALFE